MPTVTFSPSGKKVSIQKGQTLFEACQLAGLPLASSCSAQFSCGRCGVQILSGVQNCSPADEAEVALRKRQNVSHGDRIACRTQVFGDCVITTRYWSGS